MAGIPAASRSAFKRTIPRMSTPASRSPLRFYTSTMSDNDPELLEKEKQRNLSKQQHKTSTPIPDRAPGWNEALATSSEAAVKARLSSTPPFLLLTMLLADHNSGNPLELQERTVAYIKRRHHESESPLPHEPGVSTEAMQNGEAPTEASYSRDEIDGPLKTAPGTIVEELEYKEDVITRKAAA
ncbi:hypothetical protein LXA43DRAFT_1089615 [Ganoderma leucocontextum]|nr:hypothetical protein LXA43DRAFT_1089615 [Ganoderma leucocontextum]